ncbi:MAG: sensor histidine kinase [Solirubrobacteraceae bacterium]
MGSCRRALPTRSKHARATHAEVTVRYAPNAVGIEVHDDGTGATPSNGHGHGLIGIRERVKLYGGEMTAGTTNGGGFTLSTRLPLTPDRP